MLKKSKENQKQQSGEQQSQVSTFHNIYNKHATVWNWKQEGFWSQRMLQHGVAGVCGRPQLALHVAWNLTLSAGMTTQIFFASWPDRRATCCMLFLGFFFVVVSFLNLFIEALPLGGYRIYVPLSYLPGSFISFLLSSFFLGILCVCLTIIHKYGQCLVVNN